MHHASKHWRREPWGYLFRGIAVGSRELTVSAPERGATKGAATQSRHNNNNGSSASVRGHQQIPNHRQGNIYKQRRPPFRNLLDTARAQTGSDSFQGAHASEAEFVFTHGPPTNSRDHMMARPPQLPLHFLYSDRRFARERNRGQTKFLSHDAFEASTTTTPRERL